MINASVKGLSAVNRDTVRSPLFKEQLLSLGKAERHVLIDLGPARSKTLAVLNGSRCRLDIVNLPELLKRYSFESDSDELMKALAQRIMCSDIEQADLVLCWTLLNYLDPSQLKRLMLLLEKRLAPNAKIHALIVSSSTLLYKEPPGVCAEDHENLLIESSEEAPSCPSPKYSLGTLEKNMQGFKSERTMLLSNGMREYIFCRQ